MGINAVGDVDEISVRGGARAAGFSSGRAYCPSYGFDLSVSSLARWLSSVELIELTSCSDPGCAVALAACTFSSKACAAYCVFSAIIAIDSVMLASCLQASSGSECVLGESARVLLPALPRLLCFWLPDEADTHCACVASFSRESDGWFLFSPAADVMCGSPS